jgi:multidrug efflux pump subunit AcrA (membrane-fusion protein)
VQLLDADGKVVETTSVDFISPQVDSQLQGILLKAPVHSTLDVLRSAQLVKARVIWKTSPQPVIPYLQFRGRGGRHSYSLRSSSRTVTLPPARQL